MKNYLLLILEGFFLCIFYSHGVAEKPERDLNLFDAQYVLRLERCLSFMILTIYVYE